MKIEVRAEGHHFSFYVPNGMILNGISSRILVHYLSDTSNVTLQQMNTLTKELKRCKKSFPNVPLVEVFSADGEMVKITL